MSAHWSYLLGLVGAAVSGVLLASLFWWWAAPRTLLMRWSAPLRDALDAGFSDQALQYRLRAQADKLWARRQQALWRESLEQVLARHEACLLAEIRLLLRAAGQTAGGLTRAVPIPRSAPAASAVPPLAAKSPPPAGSTAPASLARSVAASAAAATTHRGMPTATLTDAELDALVPELPAPDVAGRRRTRVASAPSKSFKSI